jgi:hypothetical protein
MTAMLTVLCLAVAAQAVQTHYYVAVDSLEVLTSGTYTGLPNPNHGRLTLLFAHTDEENPSSNHFHAIGAYSYTGPVDNPTVIPTNSNNRIPEISTGQLPLRLLPGTGQYRDQLISRPTAEEYSHLKIESIQALSGFPSDSPEGFLFHSSNGRWTAPLTDAVVALQRVSLSLGFDVVDPAGNKLFRKKPSYRLGDGDTLAFTPTYVAKRSAPIGTYSATFKLVDLGSRDVPMGESGSFTFDFRVPQRGDLDGDNDVDSDDVLILVLALGNPVTDPDDPRDLNHDGTINVADLVILLDLLV